MMGGQEDIWYCTNIEYMNYMDSFSRLQFATDNHFVYNPNAEDCYIAVNDQTPIRIPAGQTVQL